MNPKKLPEIDISDELFGCIFNCAVRYACGRQTYMPYLVINELLPLLPYLSRKTLQYFDQDLTNAKYETGYGDPNIDEPMWISFHNAVREERRLRSEAPYKDWHPADYPVVRQKDDGYVTISFSIDAQLKRDAEQVLEELGYSLEQAIVLFFRFCSDFPEEAIALIRQWEKEQSTM